MYSHCSNWRLLERLVSIDFPRKKIIRSFHKGMCTRACVYVYLRAMRPTAHVTLIQLLLFYWIPRYATFLVRLSLSHTNTHIYTYTLIILLHSFWCICCLSHLSFSLTSVVWAWLLAVLVGLSAGSILRRLGPSVTGSLCYPITFFMYAAMITSGVFVHSFFLVECGQEQPNLVYRYISLIDVGLTSCIALSFFFNGLIDLNVMSEREFSS